MLDGMGWDRMDGWVRTEAKINERCAMYVVEEEGTSGRGGAEES